MQIELIGCTSAGKSTLAQQMVETCRWQGMGVVLGDDLVLGLLRAQKLQGRRLRRLLVNLLALGACMATWRANRSIYLYAARCMARQPGPLLEKLHTLRNLLARVGVYEIARLRGRRHVVVVDEGLLQAANYLFVRVSAPVDAGHLRQFADLVPLPDAIVYVRQPESLLIARTMARGHKRIPPGARGSTERFIRRSVALFDQLAHHPAIAPRLLTVGGDGSDRPVAGTQDDPAMELAQKVVRCGLGVATDAEPEASPGPHAVSVPVDLSGMEPDGIG